MRLFLYEKKLLDEIKKCDEAIVSTNGLPESTENALLELAQKVKRSTLIGCVCDFRKAVGLESEKTKESAQVSQGSCEDQHGIEPEAIKDS